MRSTGVVRQRIGTMRRRFRASALHTIIPAAKAGPNACRDTLVLMSPFNAAAVARVR